jgi:peptidoglycan lytic transglycosylase
VLSLAFKLGKHRLLLIIVGVVIVIGASLPPFLTASCFTHQQTPAEARALQTLRAMTRGGVLPAEDVLVRLESQFPRTQVAGLAHLVRARIRINARDFAGAADLLQDHVIYDNTGLGDYALFMRADSLEQSGRRADARAAYQKLAHDYPDSLRARDAVLRLAQFALADGQPAVVPGVLAKLAAGEDATALLLTGKAYEEGADTQHALAAYRRIYFYAPSSSESNEAASAMLRLASTNAPGNKEEALARATRLFDGKRYADAADAYTVAFANFPPTATDENQLRSGIAAANAGRINDAATALNRVSAGAGETRAQALYYLATAYARAKQWAPARATAEQLRREFPSSSWTARAFAGVGQIADESKNKVDASYFKKTAVTAFPGTGEVAQAQFNLAWDTHEAKNYASSSELLTEHLAFYADKNTDNRGRAAYWAARDSERSGKLAEAKAIYEALQVRYDANWYGYLARLRLDALKHTRIPEKIFPSESVVGRAIANLQTVTVAEETSGPAEAARIDKAEQLTIIGADDWALGELAKAAEAVPFSPRVNLAIAQIYRSQEDNVRALNTLRQSYPDYSQMEPQELTPEEWDVFYPLAYWDVIVQESRARRLDPYQVAGLIRQETVFSPRARSVAKAYGLMQVLVPTAILTARKNGMDRTITAEALYEPRLNIQLGTAYLRDQIDKFGRIEYVAAAYNAGPLRARQWQNSLPSEIDEWVESIPFRETRGYVQGVVRNRLQYERLYDANGQFKAEVGSQAVSAGPTAAPGGAPALSTGSPTVRKRRVTVSDNEE